MSVAHRLDTVAQMDIEPGGADFTPRLSDKILSAFTHAYAAGEIEIARHLRRILESNERARGRCGGKAAGKGKSNGQSRVDPVARADQWVVFVEARNQYWAVTHRGGAKTADIDQALDRMKDAYRRYSQG